MNSEKHECRTACYLNDNCPADQSVWSRMAVDQNRAEVWNGLWSNPETSDWRGEVLSEVYERIAELIPAGRVVDIGGGIGVLAERLRNKSLAVEVWEHSEEAISACRMKGIPARYVDLEAATKLDDGYSIRKGHLSAIEVHLEREYVPSLPTFVGRILVATEVLEHLSNQALDRLMRVASQTGAPCFFSVPNDRLGPDEEKQHARKWTALEFKRFLQTYFKNVRVEVLGPPAQLGPPFHSDRGQPCYLLGICGFEKKQEVSMCFPARDEAADIEKCLASFMGFADEIIVGIDPRTKDKTKEIAEKYADVVFELDEVLGPPGEEVPEGGFHFSHARNKCMDRCTKPWIFMTEAHEPLWKGHDGLLRLHQIPDYVQVLHVLRTGGRPLYRQQWLFPWLCRNNPKFRYKRSTHNTLEYGDAPHLIIPQIKTLHERVHEKDLARQKQRKVQNRIKLMEDWLEHANEWSLHYLGAEWREWDREKAIRYLREYLVISKSGPLRYHTRLILAKELGRGGELDEACEVLYAAPGDDWTRAEHWVFLGDIAFDRERYEEAKIFYSYAVTMRGGPPLTSWWIDLSMYSWIPAQRLAMTYSALGDLEKALYWAKLLLSDFEKEDAPLPIIEEAKTNICTIEEAINGQDAKAAE